MGQPQPQPPSNILTPCLQPQLHLVSVVQTQHPNNTYHTYFSHSGREQAGLDRILAIQEHIHSACSSGIDHEISRAFLKSNYYLIYASFALSYPDTSPIQPAIKQFNYRRVATIPLIKIYPTEPKDKYPTILARHSVMTSINALTVSQRKDRSWPCNNMNFPVTDMLSGLRKQSITQSPFSQPNMHILRYPTCVEQNKGSHLHVPLQTWLPPSNHKRSFYHQKRLINSWCATMYMLYTPETNDASRNTSYSLFNHIMMTTHGTHPHSSYTNLLLRCNGF